MLKSIWRLFFRPRYSPPKKPFEDTLAYRAGRGLTGPPMSTKPSQSELRSTGGAFDASKAQAVETARVLEGPAFVTDGDTITIQKTQVRLYGIDAPELNHPYGQKSKWAMVKLCKGNRIRAEITDEDEYGRTVAKCYLPDGRDLSAELVRQGLAIDWPKFSGGHYGQFEVEGIRKKLWLADARQKGRMHVWERFEARQKAESRLRH